MRRDEFYSTQLEACRPEPVLTVSEWSDLHRILPQKSSSEPGLWRTSRTPYLRDILDCLSPSSPYHTVVFAKGTQVGATEAGNNWIGYVIHHAPGPMLAVSPTVELAKRASKQRIAPMIDVTPVLAARVAPARERDSGNSLFSK
jgi:phage terminase large subunit GpA-like protein